MLTLLRTVLIMDNMSDSSFAEGVSGIFNPNWAHHTEPRATPYETKSDDDDDDADDAAAVLVHFDRHASCSTALSSIAEERLAEDFALESPCPCPCFLLLEEPLPVDVLAAFE